MEVRATYREARVSKALGAAVMVFIGLWLGIISGFLVSSLAGGNVVSTSHVAPAAVVDQGGPQSDLTRALPESGAAQGGPQSDLTRALPTAAPAVLPAWLVQEITPKGSTTQRVRQDDPNFIALQAKASSDAWSRSR